MIGLVDLAFSATPPLLLPVLALRQPVPEDSEQVCLGEAIIRRHPLGLVPSDAASAALRIALGGDLEVIAVRDRLRAAGVYDAAVVLSRALTAADAALEAGGRDEIRRHRDRVRHYAARRARIDRLWGEITAELE